MGNAIAPSMRMRLPLPCPHMELAKVAEAGRRKAGRLVERANKNALANAAWCAPHDETSI